MKKLKPMRGLPKQGFRKMLSRLIGAALMAGVTLAGTTSHAQGPSNPKQNPLWLLSNGIVNPATKHDRFRFYYNGAPAVVNTTLGLVNQYQETVTHVFNSMPDNNGNLNFYAGLFGPLTGGNVIQEDGQGSVQIIRSDGHQIGKFFGGPFGPTESYNYPEFIIVPLNNDCQPPVSQVFRQPGYVVMAYNPASATATAGKVWYGVVYPGTPGISNDRLIGPYTPDNSGNYGATNPMPDITSAKGTFAAPKPVAGRTQFVYLATSDGIRKFEINPNYLNGTQVGAVRTPNNEPVLNGANTFIQSGSYGDISELEVSEDGTKLAWANKNSKVVNVLTLNPVTGNKVSGPVSININTNGNGINGLEFIPNSAGNGYSLYVTAGVDGNSSDGLFRVNYNTSTNSYPASVPNGNANDGGRVTGTYADIIAESHIETDYNGNMVLLAEDLMVRVNPNVGLGAFLPPVYFAKATPYPANYGTIRRLPRQIDGWHYNVAGLVYGQSSVQVSGAGANPTQSYSAPVIPGASYNWTVTDPNNNTYSLGGGATTNFTFPSSPVGVYTVAVTVTYNNVCQTQTTGRLSVTTNGGFWDRMAKPEGGATGNFTSATIYPNPATDRFELRLPAMEGDATVRIMDVNGKTCKTFTTKQQQQTVEVADLKSGLYLLQVDSGKLTATQRLVIMK